MRLIEPDTQYTQQVFQLIQQNMEEFSQRMPWPRFIKQPADTERFLGDALTSNQSGASLVKLIEHENRIAGVISFNRIDKGNKTAYLGYWLGAAFQGKGLVTQAVNELVDEYSRDNRIQRFVIKCITSNEKSNQVAKRCGFELEGVLKKAEIIGGVAYDQNLYAKVI